MSGLVGGLMSGSVGGRSLVARAASVASLVGAAGLAAGQSSVLTVGTAVPSQATVLPVDIELGRANLIGSRSLVLFTTRDPAEVAGLSGAALEAVVPTGTVPDEIVRVPGLFQQITAGDVAAFDPADNLIGVGTQIRSNGSFGPQAFSEFVYRFELESDPSDLVQVRLTANPLPAGVDAGFTGTGGQVLSMIGGTLESRTDTAFITTVMGDFVSLGHIPRLFVYDAALGTSENFLGFYRGAAPGGTEPGRVPYTVIIDPRTGSLVGLDLSEAIGAWDLNLVVQAFQPAECNGPGSGVVGGTRELGVDQLAGALTKTPGGTGAVEGFAVGVNLADASLGLTNEVCAYFEGEAGSPGETPRFAGFVNEAGPEWVVEFTLETAGALTIEDEFAVAVDDGVQTTEDNGPSRFWVLGSTALVTGVDVLGDGTLLGAGAVSLAFSANSEAGWPSDFDGDGDFDADSLGFFDPGTYYLVIDSDLGGLVSAPGPVSIDVFFHDPLTCGDLSSTAFIPGSGPGSGPGTGVRASDFVFTTPITGEVFGLDALGVGMLDSFGASVICGYERPRAEGGFERIEFDEFQDPVWENTEIVYEFTTTVPLRFNLEDDTIGPGGVNVDAFLLDSNEVLTGADLFGDGGSTRGVVSRSVVASLVGDAASQNQGVLGGISAVQPPGTYYLVLERYRAESGERGLFIEFLNPLESVEGSGLQRTVPPLDSPEIIDLGVVGPEETRLIITMCDGLTDPGVNTSIAVFETNEVEELRDPSGQVIRTLESLFPLFGNGALQDACGFVRGPSSSPVLDLIAGEYILAVTGGDVIIDPGTILAEDAGGSAPPVAVSGRFRIQGVGLDSGLIEPLTVDFDVAAREVAYYRFTIEPVPARGAPTGAVDLGEIPIFDSADQLGITVSTCLSDPAFDSEIGVWDETGELVASMDNSACFNQGGLHAFMTLFTDANGDGFVDADVRPGDRFYIGVAGANTTFGDRFLARRDPLSAVPPGGGEVILAVGPEFPAIFNPGPGDVVAGATVQPEGVAYFTFKIEDGFVIGGCDNPTDISDTPPGSGVFGQLDGNDIGAFITGFLSQHPIADFSDTPPGSGIVGQFDGNDIGAFIAGFVAGCPTP